MSNKIITPILVLDDSDVGPHEEVVPLKKRDRVELPPIMYPPEIDHLLKK